MDFGLRQTDKYGCRSISGNVVYAHFQLTVSFLNKHMDNVEDAISIVGVICSP